MIKTGTKFNFDGHEWEVDEIFTVEYVNYNGYVVCVLATYGSIFKGFVSATIDLLANGTPIGYSK